MNCSLLEALFYVQESAFTQERLIMRETFFVGELQLVVCGSHCLQEPSFQMHNHRSICESCQLQENRSSHVWSKHENHRCMYESCQLQEKHSKFMNCWFVWESSFAGAIVPTMRIIILWARVASSRTIILRKRIAVCGSNRHLWEPSVHVRKSPF